MVNDAEIRAALLAGTLTEKESDQIIQTALEHADEPPRLARARWGVAAAAVLVLGFALWHGVSPGDRETPAESVEEMVRRQRERNEAFLKTDKARDVLAKTNAGWWVVVVGGDAILTGERLAPLLEKAQKGRIMVYHRFTFRKGEEGNRTYTITFGDVPWMGTTFMAEADLGFGRGPGGIVITRRGKSAATEVLHHRPWIALELQAPGNSGGSVERVVVSSGSACPLLLREGRLSPLAEIPGRATLDHIGGRLPHLRRHLVRVRIPELELDGHFEAVAVPDMGDRKAGGVTWRYTSVSEDKGLAVMSGVWFGGLDEKLETSKEFWPRLGCVHSPFHRPAKRGAALLTIYPSGRSLAIDGTTKPERVKEFLSTVLDRD